jgi:hypothetical protein
VTSFNNDPGDDLDAAWTKIRTPLSFWLDVPEAFDALDAFLHELESAVESVIADQSKRASEESYDPEEGGPGVESYRATLLEETLPRTLRYSAVLLAYAAIDSLLVKLCDVVEDSRELPFSRSDMAHPFTLGSKLEYLQKALGNALPVDAFDGPFHRKLSAFSEVRHCIAHAGGEFDIAAPKQAQKARAAAKRLGFGSGSHLSIPSGAVVAMLREAREWALKVSDAVSKATPGWRLVPRGLVWEVETRNGWKAIRAANETDALKKAGRQGLHPLGPVRSRPN